MAHLVQRVSTFESQHRTLHKEKYLKGTAAMTNPYDADIDEDEEVTTTEWRWGKASVLCPWVKEKKDVYNYDVKKVDKIFDLLLEKK